MYKSTFIIGLLITVFASNIVSAETQKDSSGQIQGVSGVQGNQQNQQITGTNANGESQTATMDQNGHWQSANKPSTEMVKPSTQPSTVSASAPSPANKAVKPVTVKVTAPKDAKVTVKTETKADTSVGIKTEPMGAKETTPAVKEVIPAATGTPSAGTVETAPAGK